MSGDSSEEFYRVAAEARWKQREANPSDYRQQIPHADYIQSQVSSPGLRAGIDAVVAHIGQRTGGFVDQLALTFANRVQEIEAECRRKLDDRDLPRPGDPFHEWLKRQYYDFGDGGRIVIQALISTYRRHAATGTPLDQPLPPEEIDL